MNIAYFLAPIAAVSVFAMFATPAAAVPAVVTVTSSVSGSAGAWVHDFTVSNNLPAGNNLYFFGVQLPTGRAIVASPSSFNAEAFPSWLDEEEGSSGIEYNNVWINFSDSILSGTSLSGFRALDTSEVAATFVPYFAFAFGGEYTGPECWRCGSNPGFEGFADVSPAAAVPEPASWAMLIAGFGLTGAVARQRRRLAAA